MRLQIVKWFQVLLSNTNSFIYTELNGFKYYCLTLIVLFEHSKMFFNTNNSIHHYSFAHS